MALQNIDKLLELVRFMPDGKLDAKGLERVAQLATGNKVDSGLAKVLSGFTEVEKRGEHIALRRTEPYEFKINRNLPVGASIDGVELRDLSFDLRKENGKVRADNVSGLVLKSSGLGHDFESDIKQIRLGRNEEGLLTVAATIENPLPASMQIAGGLPADFEPEFVITNGDRFKLTNGDDLKFDALKGAVVNGAAGTILGPGGALGAAVVQRLLR